MAKRWHEIVWGLTSIYNALQWELCSNEPSKWSYQVQYGGQLQAQINDIKLKCPIIKSNGNLKLAEALITTPAFLPEIYVVVLLLCVIY